MSSLISVSSANALSQWVNENEKKLNSEILKIKHLLIDRFGRIPKRLDLGPLVVRNEKPEDGGAPCFYIEDTSVQKEMSSFEEQIEMVHRVQEAIKEKIPSRGVLSPPPPKVFEIMRH